MGKGAEVSSKIEWRLRFWTPGFSRLARSTVHGATTLAFSWHSRLQAAENVFEHIPAVYTPRSRSSLLLPKGLARRAFLYIHPTHSRFISFAGDQDEGRGYARWREQVEQESQRTTRKLDSWYNSRSSAHPQAPNTLAVPPTTPLKYAAYHSVTMKRSTFNLATALAAVFSLASADNIPTCGENNACPEATPCCSQYGQCGVGAYCLGGCDPRYSFNLQSCVAAPVCQSADYKLNSLNDVMPNTQYLGDPSTANWVSSGTPVVYNNDSILLTMAPSTVGTLLMSTHYVWYGQISATMTTSQGAGVVTAFILMSDVHDEIDFEFVGVDLEHAQSNYYFQGITDCEYNAKIW